MSFFTFFSFKKPLTDVQMHLVREFIEIAKMHGFAKSFAASIVSAKHYISLGINTDNCKEKLSFLFPYLECFIQANEIVKIDLTKAMLLTDISKINEQNNLLLLKAIQAFIHHPCGSSIQAVTLPISSNHDGDLNQLKSLCEHLPKQSHLKSISLKWQRNKQELSDEAVIHLIKSTRKTEISLDLTHFISDEQFKRCMTHQENILEQSCCLG